MIASIIQTSLLIFINWIFLAKPLSMRPLFPFFTLIPSLLYLLSHSTQAIFLISYCHNYTYLISLLFIASPTFLESSLFLSLFFSTNIIEVNQEVIAANTLNTKVTPTPPLFQALYITSMLYLGRSSSLFWEKTNISKL